MKKTQSGFSSVLIVIIIIFLGLVGFLYIRNKEKIITDSSPQATKPELTSQPTIKPQAEALPVDKPITKFLEQALSNSKIVFTKDGDLFFLDKKGLKQLTATGQVDKFKISPDGKYVVWSNKKAFAYSDEPKKTHQEDFSLSIIDLQTREIKELVKKFPEDRYSSMTYHQGGDNWNIPMLYDFSFVGNDSSQIVYVWDGVRVKNINTQKDDLLLADVSDQDNKDNPVFYNTVDASPFDNLILLRKGPFGPNPEIYNLSTKEKSFPKNLDAYPTNHVSFVWTPDKKNIIVHSISRSGVPGLWIYNIEKDTEKEIIPTSDYAFLSTNGISLSKDNNLIGIIGPFIEGAQTKLPTKQEAIYKISMEGKYTLLFDPKLEKLNDYDYPGIYDIHFSSDNSKIGFSQCHQYPLKMNPENNDFKTICDLHTIDPNGENDNYVVSNISSYLWLP